MEVEAIVPVLMEVAEVLVQEEAQPHQILLNQVQEEIAVIWHHHNPEEVQTISTVLQIEDISLVQLKLQVAEMEALRKHLHLEEVVLQRPVQAPPGVVEGKPVQLEQHLQVLLPLLEKEAQEQALQIAMPIHVQNIVIKNTKAIIEVVLQSILAQEAIVNKAPVAE